MKPLRLLGLTNSLRAGSYNRMVLDLVAELWLSATLQRHDLAALPFYEHDLEQAGMPGAVLRLAEAVRQVDGLVIASPEYNHSIPAVIKNAIDWLSRVADEPLGGMPVMLLSASSGLLGGARMQYDLRRVLDAVGALPLVRPEVFIGVAAQKFDAQGRCTDARTRDAVRHQIAAFAGFVERHRERLADAAETDTDAARVA
jgi:chromate reductase, NAD(P)H dehydrogenase (quinone)